MTGKLRERANLKGGQADGVALVGCESYAVEETTARPPSYYRALAAAMGDALHATVRIGRTTIAAPGASVAGDLKVRAPVETDRPVVQKYAAEDGEWRRRSTSESAWSGWRPIYSEDTPPPISAIDKGSLTASAASNLIRDPTFLNCGAEGEDVYWVLGEGWQVTTSSSGLDALGAARALQCPPGTGTTEAGENSTVTVSPSRPLIPEPGKVYKAKVKVWYPAGFVGRLNLNVIFVPVQGSTTLALSLQGTDYTSAPAASADVEELTGKFAVPAGNIMAGPPRELRLTIGVGRSGSIVNPLDKPLVLARPAIAPVEKTTDLVNAEGTVSLGDANFLAGPVASGWADPSGTLSRASFDPATVTLEGLAQRVAALIADAKARGVLGG